MNLFTVAELTAKIASNDYGAELCLAHAMLNIEKLLIKNAELQALVAKYVQVASESSENMRDLDIVERLQIDGSELSIAAAKYIRLKLLAIQQLHSRVSQLKAEVSANPSAVLQGTGHS